MGVQKKVSSILTKIYLSLFIYNLCGHLQPCLDDNILPLIQLNIIYFRRLSSVLFFQKHTSATNVVKVSGGNHAAEF